MNKKIFIITTILVLLIGCSFGIYHATKGKKKTKEEIKVETVVKEVKTVITMDINPSIRINLDENDKVIDVIALNEDAKNLISEDYKNKDLESTINDISNKLVEQKIIEDKVELLLNVQGNIKIENVEKIINDTFTTKNIECNVIVPEITETAKEYAKENNITESKAAYIESIVEKYPDLKMEEIKDKSINEITTTTVEIETKKEEEKKKEEEQKQQSTSSNNSSSGKSNSGSVGCNPPTDLKDSAWCTFNTKRPQWCIYDYPQMIKSFGGNEDELYNYVGSTAYESLGLYKTQQLYEGASYCYAIKKVLTTRQYRYTFLFDSVTNEKLSETKEPVPTPIMTEDEALQNGLNYYGLSQDNCKNCWVTYGTNAEGSEHWYYRYQVNMVMNDDKGYSIDYNTQTGAIESTRTWENH